MIEVENFVSRIAEQPERSALFSDLDGTLADTSVWPDEITVPERTLDTLDALSDRLGCVGIVSGRPVAEIKEMVPVDGIVFIGNHGLERDVGRGSEVDSGVQPHLSGLDRVRESPRLSDMVDDFGIRVRDKGSVISLHYRGMEELSEGSGLLEDLRSRARSLAEDSGVVFIDGKKVLEFFPPAGANKGTAVLDVMRELRLERAVFMGDDTTDLDVFREFRKSPYLEGLMVGVIASDTPSEVLESADLILGGIQEVVSFLEDVLLRL